MDKSLLRKELIKLRKSLNDVSKELVTDLLSSNILDDKKLIGLYYPLKYEIDVLSLLNDKTHEYCFPKVIDGELVFYKVKSLNDFKEGYFHVYEPITNEVVKRDDIDLFIIPCVGITKNNQRIGYGKGFYDRYLDGYKGMKIALNYKECSHLDFIANSYDVRMDKVFVR